MLAQGSRAENAQRDEPTHDERRLEDEHDSDEHGHDEAVVRGGADQLVELRDVVVREEVNGARQEDPVAESHACRREEDGAGGEDEHLAFRRGVEGRGEKEPELPENDRQRQHEAGVDADHDGDRERLRHSERHGRLVVGRQRAVQPVEKVRVEEVGEDRPDGDRAEHDEEPAAELLEVLAERRLLGVAETARKPRHVPLDGLALGLGRRRRRRDDGRLCRRELGLRLGVGLRVAGDRILELAHPVPERLADLGQPLAAEEQQRDQKEQDDVPGSLEIPHVGRVARFSQRLRGLDGPPGPSRYPERMALLKLENLHVALEDGTEIVKGVDLEVDTNEVHAVMGPNGSGKSTLAYALMGHPAYEITEGRLFFDGEDVTELGADERAQRGLFLAFQYPHAIPGVTVTSFLRSAINAVRKARNGGVDDPIAIPEFRTELLAQMDRLKVSRELASRYLNDGFSGGEKKRVEILQMAMLKPRIAVLDETDSGLDIDALRVVASGVNELVGPDMGALVITHYQRILDYVTPDRVHVFVGGRIVESGGAELAKKLEKEGYVPYEPEEVPA